MRPILYPPAPDFCREIRHIGVTGTNGKTSTVHFLAAILSELDRALPWLSTLGAFCGKHPASEISPDHPGLVEMMRAAKARGCTASVLELTSESLGKGFAAAWPLFGGVFTNISQDHGDRHPSPEHYLAAKAQLFRHLMAGGFAVLHQQGEASNLLTEIIPRSVRRVSYAEASAPEPVSTHPSGSPPDLLFHQTELSWAGTQACLQPNSLIAEELALPKQLSTPAIGGIYLENAIGALLAASLFGVCPNRAVEILSQTPPPKGRFELLRQSPHVIVDYAHNPQALSRTLRCAKQLCSGELWVIFGAGGERDRRKRPAMGLAASQADHIILTSDNPRGEHPKAIADEIALGIPRALGQARVELCRQSAIQLALDEANPNDIILIAGKGHEGDTISQAGSVQPSDHTLIQQLWPI